MFSVEGTLWNDFCSLEGQYQKLELQVEIKTTQARKCFTDVPKQLFTVYR